MDDQTSFEEKDFVELKEYVLRKREKVSTDTVLIPGKSLRFQYSSTKYGDEEIEIYRINDNLTSDLLFIATKTVHKQVKPQFELNSVTKDSTLTMSLLLERMKTKKKRGQRKWGKGGTRVVPPLEVVARLRIGLNVPSDSQ